MKCSIRVLLALHGWASVTGTVCSLYRCPAIRQGPSYVRGWATAIEWFPAFVRIREVTS